MPNRLLRLALIAITINGLAACSADRFVNGLRWITYSQPVTEADLKGMVSSGTRMSMSWANGESGTITYNSDGSAIADVQGKSVQGKWQIQNGRLCTNWDPSDENVGQCYRVYRARGNALKMFDERGSFHARATIPSVSS